MGKRLAEICICFWVLFALAPVALAEETPVPAELPAETTASVVADDTSDEIVQLAVDTVTADAGGEVKLTLSIAHGNGVDSLECNLNYDAAALKITRVEAGVTFPAEYCITNTNEAGRVRLATACTFGLDNEQGAVIILHGKLTGNAGSAVTITDARVTTVGAEYVQSKAYVSVTNGGVSVGGALPQSLVTPWIPETPEPPATPTPAPTEAPLPEIVETFAPAETPEPSPEPEANSKAMLPYVIAGVMAVLLAAGIVILIVSSSQKKKRKKKRKSSGSKRR